MSKAKSVFICRSCGYESPKWNGRCPSCGEWNTFEETEPVVLKSSSSARTASRVSQKAVNLNDVDLTETSEVRYKTGFNELDRVLGGGLVKGSLVLLGGEPGIGKSTLFCFRYAVFWETKTVFFMSRARNP